MVLGPAPAFDFYKKIYYNIYIKEKEKIKMEKDYFVLKIVKPQFPFKLIEFLKRNNFDAYYRSNKNVFIKIYFENNYPILEEEDILEEMDIIAENIENFISNNFHYNYYIEPVFYHRKRR